MTKTSHHWIGLKPNPDKFFGFVYLIIEEDTQRTYVGKRQYWQSNSKVKKTSLRPNKDPLIWNPKHWKPAKWEYYTSSSTELNALIKDNPKGFTYMMIGQYMCKADLVYGEVKAQMHFEVMTLRGEDGNRLSYNKQVGAVRFIPPCLEREENYG